MRGAAAAAGPEAGVGDAARALEDEAGEVAVAPGNCAARLPQRKEEVRHDPVQRRADDGDVADARPGRYGPRRPPQAAGNHGGAEPALVCNESVSQAREEMLLPSKGYTFMT